MRLAARRTSARELEVGGSVDGYLVEDFEPGRGAAELVCEAVSPSGDAVTLVMAWSRRPDRQSLARFRRLARIRATLEHEALLRVQAVGDHSGRPYLAMDRYPEETFEDVLEGAPLPAERVLRQLAPVCDALDQAHASGLVHQSLSGASLLVEGDSLLLDGFGLTGGPRELTFESVGVHEVRHSAPEELRGEPVDAASNVYSLTSLLVHALTGSPPYGGPPGSQAYGHLMEPPPQPSARIPELGPALDEVVARGMAKEPAERPASALELLADAAGALGVDLPVRSAPGEDREARIADAAPVRARRISKPALAAVLIVVSLAGLGAGAALDPFDGGGASAAEPNADARAVERLNAQRAPLRAELAGSETPQQQAATAAELATAYGGVADLADSRALVEAARSAERAYDELGAAAEAGSAERFAAASDAVTQADARLASVAAGSR